MRVHRQNCLKWSETPPFVCTCGVMEEAHAKLRAALKDIASTDAWLLGAAHVRKARAALKEDD